MSRVLELLLRGVENQFAESAKQETEKRGILRIGNSGMLTPSGDYVGSCPRLTYLRAIGVESDPVTVQKDLMFAGGRANEDIWVAALSAAKEEGLVIKCEEEIPVAYELESGAKVSGRPDVVLGKMQGDSFVPEIGIELKQIMSLWTAREVLFEGKPKLDHLLQAGHYAKKLGIPYELWYTNRSNYAIPDFAKKWLPKQGAPLSEYCGYNGKGEVKSVEPFVVGYELQWSPKDQLLYRQIPAPGEEAGKWTYTIITWEGIQKYYESVASLLQSGGETLPSRPKNVGYNGEAAGYSKCDYCPLKPTCTAHEGKGRTKWQAEVQKLVDSRNENK